MTMLNEVEATVTALALEDVDTAAVALMKALAAELDGAAAVRVRADRAVKEARLRGDDEHIAEVEALRAKLSERAALVSIGSMLHKILAEMQATPKSRGGIKRLPSQENSLARIRGGKLRSV